jgi:hypothetical protein
VVQGKIQGGQRAAEEVAEPQRALATSM